MKMITSKIKVHAVDDRVASSRAHFETHRAVLIILLVAICSSLGSYLLFITGILPINDNSLTMSHSVINEYEFGKTKDGQLVKAYKIQNDKGKMEVELIAYGGSLKSIKVPDKNGKVVDVTLGFDKLEDYEGPTNPYFGALVGRVANRIANATFKYDGVQYNLPANNGPNTLHGGPLGWGKLVWKSRIEGNKVIMSKVSPDGDQGFPGEVTCHVVVSVTDDRELRLEYHATTNRTTPINLTVHPYFNLAGEGKGTIHDHNVTFYADRYIPVDDGLIPTGEIAPVDGTLFDMRTAIRLGDRVNNIPGDGYDHNFCVNGPTGKRKAARFSAPSTGIVMDVYTDQPGVQFYTGNRIDVQNGKHGHKYSKHSGFALETQNYPDAVNNEHFPDPFLIPESEYHHLVVHKFSTL